MEALIKVATLESSSTSSVTVSKSADYVSISNDGASDITVTVSAPTPITFTVRSNEEVKSFFKPFKTVSITATSTAYRCWIYEKGVV